MRKSDARWIWLGIIAGALTALLCWGLSIERVSGADHLRSSLVATGYSHAAFLSGDVCARLSQRGVFVYWNSPHLSPPFCRLEDIYP